MCRAFAPFGGTGAPRERRPNPIKMCNAAQTPADDLLGHNVGTTGVRFSALWAPKDESGTAAGHTVGWEWVKGGCGEMGWCMVAGGLVGGTGYGKRGVGGWRGGGGVALGDN